MTKWTAEDISHLYWLSLWGCSPKDIIDLTKDLMPYRTILSIGSEITEVRRFIAYAKGNKETKKPSPITKILARQGSKIPPVKSIADLRPPDDGLDRFIHPKNNNQLGIPKVSTEHKYEQLKEGEENIKSKMPDGWKLQDGKDLSAIKKAAALAGYEQIKKPRLPTGGLKEELPVRGEVVSTDFSLESVLQIARKNGARKVYWNGYTIKF